MTTSPTDLHLHQGYIPTAYRQTAHFTKPPGLPLSENIETDICIIGGGLAGLNTALSLTEKGHAVTILESNRIGWGASGRNGGLALSSFDYGMPKVAARVGPENARKIFDLTTDALTLIKERTSQYAIPCGSLPPGIAVLACTGTPESIQAEIASHNRLYGTNWAYWNREETQQNFKSGRYLGATFMPETFQLEPLEYCLGLGHAIERLGGRIFEQTTCSAIKKKNDSYVLETASGHKVSARHVVIAVSGYITPKLSLPLYSATMPINTYIAVTEPLTPDQRAQSVNCNYAAYDSRHIMNYFRLLPDGRLLWGGGAGVLKDPTPLDEWMKADLGAFFPALKDVRINIAWAGTMGCSRHRMPQIGQLPSGIWYNIGHCGQGLATTTMGGTLIADAITGSNRTLDLFTPFGLDFTGGHFGKLAAAAFCGYLKILDKIELKSARNPLSRA